MIREIVYLPLWYLKNVVFGAHHPLQTVIAITDVCNLRCRHCAPEAHACTGMKPYRMIQEELEYSYRMGSRFVDFEGGEPTLWHDGDYVLNDLYRLAKEIGFFSCTLTTNAQQSFADTWADSVWVSVDGYREYHEQMRGPGTWEKLEKNIRECGLRHVSINMVITALNKDSVEDVIDFARSNPAIESISLNFLTPYPGTEELLLSWEERCRMIDLIIEKKKKGYPVMNSISGLRLMKKQEFRRACWISNFILMDGTRLQECPGKVLDLCENCGFCMAGEMAAVVHLKPDTLLAGVKLRGRQE